MYQLTSKAQVRQWADQTLTIGPGLKTRPLLQPRRSLVTRTPRNHEALKNFWPSSNRDEVPCSMATGKNTYPWLWLVEEPRRMTSRCGLTGWQVEEKSSWSLLIPVTSISYKCQAQRSQLRSMKWITICCLTRMPYLLDGKKIYPYCSTTKFCPHQWVMRLLWLTLPRMVPFWLLRQRDWKFMMQSDQIWKGTRNVRGTPRIHLLRRLKCLLINENFINLYHIVTCYNSEPHLK